MNILQLYSNENFGIYNKSFAKKHGLYNAIVFGNFCSMAQKFDNNFFFLIEDIADQCCICPDSVSKSIKYLKDNKFITSERRGIPSKIWYAVNEQKLYDDLKNDSKNDLKSKHALSNKPTDFSGGLQPDFSGGYIYNNINTNNTEIVSQSTSTIVDVSNETIEAPQEPNDVSVFNDQSTFIKEEKQETVLTEKQEIIFTKKQECFFTEKKEKIITEKSSYINSFEFKMVEYLIEELDLKNKIPTEENNYKTTKIITRAMDFIHQIENGTFIKKNKVEDRLQESIIEKTLDKPRIQAILKKDLEKVIQQFKLRLKGEYEPRDKTSLQSMNVDTLFYNPINQFSWYYHCLTEDALLIRTEHIRKLEEKLPKGFVREFDKIFDFEMSEETKNTYILHLQNIYSKWKRLDYLYDGLLTTSAWLNYMGSANGFARVICQFLSNYPHDSIHVLGKNSKMWDDFRRYAIKDFGFDIEPNAEKMEEIKKDEEWKEKYRNRTQNRNFKKEDTKEELEQYLSVIDF